MKQSIANNTKDKGFFKALIPLNQKDGHIEIFEKEIGNGLKVKYLRGTATNTQIDKEDERMSKAFVDKIKSTVQGLNVFAEHEHSIEKTVGYIDEVIDEGDSVVVDTALENENDNPLVKSILNKIKHGTKIGYSIGGRITKASKYFDEQLKKTITEIEDGEIYEVSLTAMPAGVDTWTVPIKKSLSDLFTQPEIQEQLQKETDTAKPTTKAESVDDNLVKKFTKALDEMVQTNKVKDEMWDIFYAFRESLYSIVETSELTPTQKKEKILGVANEFAVKIEELATEMAELTATIEAQLGIPAEG
jgi:HK97 family phage prohead protease